MIYLVIIIIVTINFSFLNSRSWIREVVIVNSWSWNLGFTKLKSCIHEYGFVKLKSWIHEVEIVNSLSWNHGFMKLKSWIREVEIENSWSCHREFMKLKCPHRSLVVISRLKFLVSRFQSRTKGIFYILLPINMNQFSLLYYTICKYKLLDFIPGEF
jgi:hypothetical protein